MRCERHSRHGCVCGWAVLHRAQSAKSHQMQDMKGFRITSFGRFKTRTRHTDDFAGLINPVDSVPYLSCVTGGS